MENYLNIYKSFLFCLIYSDNKQRIAYVQLNNLNLIDYICNNCLEVFFFFFFNYLCVEFCLLLDKGGVKFSTNGQPDEGRREN
jgi:hypothetical protein